MRGGTGGNNSSMVLHTDREYGFNRGAGADGGRYEARLSPHSRMILESEKQFLDNYGRRTEIERRTMHGGVVQEESMWDKLSRIFTFGCIETSHNNNNDRS